MSGLALVLSGGGARAAYQVGVLRLLARECPDAVPDIITGVSAGGINAAFLAARPEPYADKIARLAEMWAAIHIDHVFRVDLRDLASRTVRWGGRLMSGGKSMLPPARSLVDTAPLGEFLDRVLQARHGVLEGVGANLDAGWLKAVALTGSSYTTGQSVTWVQAGEQAGLPGWERPQRRSAACTLRVEHVMASSSLPFFFPAVQVDGAWYGDGGIQLTAPLSPAIHLGAERILAVTTRYARSSAEASAAPAAPYPPPAQIAGSLFNAIFLDQFDGDALQLRRLNRLIESRPEAEREGLRPVELLVLRPSQDLGRLANAYEADLPRAFRFMTRGLGTREARSNDMLSLVMFQADYVKKLMEIGEADAAARLPEIQHFLAGRPPA